MEEEMAEGKNRVCPVASAFQQDRDSKKGLSRQIQPDRLKRTQSLTLPGTPSIYFELAGPGMRLLEGWIYPLRLRSNGGMPFRRQA